MINSAGINPNRTEAQPERKTTENMDSGDFIRLMLAQLENQDPAKPSDPAKFVAELAQFSSLESLDAIKDSVGQQAETSTSQQIVQATSLMDKGVFAKVDEFNLKDEPPVASFDIGNNVPNVKIEVLNGIGQPIQEINLGNMPAGQHEFQWDRTTANGNTVHSGKYTYKVTAEYDEFEEPLDISTDSKVIGVNVDPSSNQIIAQLANGFNVNLDNIKNITKG